MRFTLGTALLISASILASCSLEEFLISDYSISILDASGTVSGVDFGGDATNTRKQFNYRYTLVNDGIAEATSLEILIRFDFRQAEANSSYERLHTHSDILETNDSVLVEGSLDDDELDTDFEVRNLVNAVIYEIRFFNTNQSSEALSINSYDDEEGRITINNPFGPN